MAKTILETRDLCKSFGTFQAVSQVSLQFAAGQIHAVLGENGAGKSTLMKLLFGLHHPTSGEIFFHGEKVEWHSPMEAIGRGLGMVQQHFSLVETLSAIDNIMLGAETCGGWGRLNRQAAIAHIEKLLLGPQLAVPWLASVGELSVGMRQRVEILKLLFREAQILFLDEPTAVLTPQEVQEFFVVLRALKKSGRTIVVITHKLHEVFEICDTYSVLRQGRLVATGLIATAERSAIVESMIGRQSIPLSEHRQPCRQDVVLRTTNVHEAGMQRGRLQGIEFQVRAGEICGIAGVTGSGQSALVDALMGLRSVAGEIEVLGSAVLSGQTKKIRERGVGLVPEDRHHEGLWTDETCFHNMVIGFEDRFSSSGLMNEAEICAETGVWAKSFDVRAPSLQMSVGSLSGGNQQKIIFAREVSGRRPRLLICHEPTRGVDLGAIEQIHRRLLELRESGIGILLISSELDELISLSDRIIVMFEGRIVSEFTRGSYDRMQIGAAMTGASRAH